MRAKHETCKPPAPCSPSEAGTCSGAGISPVRLKRSSNSGSIQQNVIRMVAMIETTMTMMMRRQIIMIVTLVVM